MNLCYYGIDHTPNCRPRVAARCDGNVVALLKYHQSMTKNRPLLSPCSRLSSLLSRPLKMPGTSCCSFKNASLWQPSFTHTVLQFWPIQWAFITCSRVHLLCPPGKDIDYSTRKISVSKVVCSIITLDTPPPPPYSEHTNKTLLIEHSRKYGGKWGTSHTI